MKKNLSKNVFSTLFIAVLFLSGCTGFNVREERKVTNIGSVLSEKLAFYASNGNYTVSQEELQKDALMVLASTKKNKNTRSIEDISSDYKIIGIKKSTYSIQDDKKIERSASVNNNDVNVYTFQFEDSKTNEKSFVISTDDLRIGEIIAIADGELTEELKQTTFMDIVKTGLKIHINKTITEWNSTPDEEIARTVNNKDIINNPDYKAYRVFCNKNMDNYYYNLPFETQWGQSSPSNDFVEVLEGAGCPAGCVAVALAQICCNSAYPKYCSQNILTQLKNNNLVSATWNGKYDYYKMKNVDHYEYTPKAKDLENDGKNNVAALMYDIGKGVNMSYTSNGSSSTINNAYKWLKAKGFNCSEIMDYNYSSVEESILKNKPVYIRGTRLTESDSYAGHAWVIDQCAEFRCVMENIKTNDIVIIIDNFVHCNWGWSGKCNGYYLSELFKTTNGAVFNLEDMYENYDGTWEKYDYYIKDNDNYEMPRNYEYSLKMITNIDEP